MTPKKLLCPQCEDERLVEKISSPIKINVKGESISVLADLYRCLECGDQIEDPANPQDELKLAYREYRKQHHLLQPEEIKELRKQYGMTQNELATLLGFSPATVSRYENGELQEKAQDNALRLLKDPGNVIDLLTRNSDEFEQIRRVEIENTIFEELQNDPYHSIIKTLELNGESEFTGFAIYNAQKYTAVVQEIISQCPKRSVSKTKLNKLLFYADFTHFKHHKKSITGVTYLKELYGPCPQHFQTLLEMMHTNGSISIKEYKDAEMVSVGDTKIEWNFTDSERDVIAKIAKKLGELDGKKLSEISHLEKAWIVPGFKERISYGFGRYLGRVSGS